MSRPHRPGFARRGLLSDFAVTCLLVFVVLAVVVKLLQRILPLSEWFSWNVMIAFGLAALLIAALAIRHLSADSFGAANRATLSRVAFVAVLVALTVESAAPWAAVAIATVAMMLDGLDGWLARRFNVASSFGARFDMETDAFLMVVLTVLAWQYGKAGPWILIAGALRYLFVIAGKMLPFLAQPLPPRRRRQAMFVTQAIVLLVCISPLVAWPVSSALAFAGLVLLTASFSIDVAYLAQQAGRARGRRPSS